jgi:hypothetical protein
LAHRTAHHRAQCAVHLIATSESPNKIETF